jgi:2-oxoglutarate ferredoxin oxidoreductase subunit alpha
MERLNKKYETAHGLVPKPLIEKGTAARIGIIAYGSADPAVEEARDMLKEQGLPTDYLRIRAIPFTNEVHDFICAHERTYVVEMNRDGQMQQLLRIEVPECAARLISAAHMDGLPLTAKWITNQVLAGEEKSK